MCIMSQSTSVKFRLFVCSCFSFLLENHVFNGYEMLKKWPIHIQMYKVGGNSVSDTTVDCSVLVIK